MKILILTFHYPPDIGAGSFRIVPLVESLKEKLPGKVYQRALYVSRENSRTLKAASLMQAGKIEGFGALMYQTHMGLSKNYEVSCPELDLLVSLTLDLP